MEDNILPFKAKDLVDHSKMSTLEKMENLFTVLESRMEAFNRKTDPRELSAILSEISQLQGLLASLKDNLTIEQEELKKAG